ncbi:MAG: exonuclease domain-containing protein [Pseudomonadota bacterium]
MSLFSRWRFDRSLKALADSEHAVLRNYAAAAWPAHDCPAHEAAYLALDFELDGLRKGSHLLSAGWTPFEGRAISLTEAQSHDIRSDARLDDVAVIIHMIGEERAREGAPLGKVTHALITALTGRVMIAHAAGIECEATARACEKVFGTRLPIRAICTLMLERRLHPNLTESDAYRLGPTRARYGLPQYNAHDALTDAIAAAELFAAQLTRLPAGTPLSELEIS